MGFIRQCRQCTHAFEVTDEDLAYYERISPLFNEVKCSIPPPTLCPECRQQRRLCWRNERSLFTGTCTRCNKHTVSLFSPDQPHTVYCQDCWWGDNWDPLSYGRDFDFSRPFFEQYHELQLETPRPALYNIHSENSEYTNHSSSNKNCYMGVAFGDCEDCLYGLWVLHSKDVVDGLYLENCTSCYECSYSQNCFQAFFCEYCQNLTDSLFCFECRNCDYCIGCTQLQHKHYHIFNEPVSKDEFQRVKSELLSSREQFEHFRKTYEENKLKCPHRYSLQLNCTGSSGNDLYNCKNAVHCFNCRELEDCKYMFDLGNNHNSMDCYEHGWLIKSELIYECHAGQGGYHFLFCHICADSRNLIYCDICANNSADLFGCIALKYGQYCVLNKQYCKEEYEKLVPRIIEHMQETEEWGEFFPASISTFCYNQSPAPEYFPLTREEILEKGFRYSDYEQPAPAVKKTISVAELPEQVSDVSDDILDCAVLCQATNKPFRITAQELKFYRKQGLPIPTRHPDERHRNRAQLRRPRQLCDRFCENCGEKIQSCYDLERPELVYCEKCYLDAVF